VVVVVVVVVVVAMIMMAGVYLQEVTEILGSFHCIAQGILNTNNES